MNLSSCSSAFVPCSCLIYARSSWPRVGSEGVLIASCLGQNCVPKLLIGLIPMPKAQPGTGGLISTISAAPVGSHVPAPFTGRS